MARPIIGTNGIMAFVSDPVVRKVMLEEDPPLLAHLKRVGWSPTQFEIRFTGVGIQPKTNIIDLDLNACTACINGKLTEIPFGVIDPLLFYV